VDWLGAQFGPMILIHAPRTYYSEANP